MNTIQATVTPRPVTLAGREFQVSTLDQTDWGKLQAWISANVPGPLETMKAAGLDGLSPAEQRTMMLVALKEQQNWPPKVGTEEWFSAMSRDGKDGKDGSAVFLWGILRKHQPEIGYADAAAIAEACSGAESRLVMLMAFGKEPTDPKASSGTPDPPAP